MFPPPPASRAKYIEWTGSSKFPQKYYAVRWLDNASTADRGREILPNLVTFVDKVEEGGREDEIKSSSFNVHVKAVKDPMLGPKLAFFSYIARLVEPFLTAYQTNKPMAPFLHTDLSALVRDLYNLFVKKDYLKEKTDVFDVDVTKDVNLIPAQDMTLSFSVKEALQKIDKPAPKKDMLKFKEECIALLKAMTLKLTEKSPLKYKICKSITFCDPELIVKHENTAKNRLRSCLSVFQRNNWISAADCDKLETEFKLLVEKSSVISLFKEYDRDKTRLDHFWQSALTTYKCSDLLRNLLHMVLIISHGNAFVERGFSINKEMVVENQLDVSLVAQRQVYDAVTLAGGIEQVADAIDHRMQYRFRSARAEYEEARKKRAQQDREGQKKKQAEKRVEDEVRELRAKKTKLLQEAQTKCDEIDEQLNRLSR
ncbi:Light-independent protochlorophyllide reductase subunit N [Frankliniella fusca]|uniref:Light-independent protochlorophyllide reductase subunit N n=1 Tax=Frankliniella fusca TaxID=407009 RepID=A0AAE1L9D6_9NEOP|nr:Light-independent protochlorophyllide reductase subunit N [Frankliniella fusca]